MGVPDFLGCKISCDTRGRGGVHIMVAHIPLRRTVRTPTLSGRSRAVSGSTASGLAAVERRAASVAFCSTAAAKCRSHDCVRTVFRSECMHLRATIA